MKLKTPSPFIFSMISLKFLRNIQLTLLLILSIASPSLVSAEDWVYTTRPGDTIWDISEKYLKSVNDWAKVKKHNNINIAKHLSPGTKLRIPLEWLKIQAAPANIVSVNGTVNFRTATDIELKPLTSKQTVNIGDIVNTGDNGSALIQFADGSTLLMQNNSQVIFNTLSSYGQTGMVDTQLRLQQGRVETSVTPMRDSGSRYEITTPAAVAAVRGTQFRVAYQDNQQTMASEVVKGSINIAAQGETQAVELGFGTITEKGKAPQAPVKLLQMPDLNTIPEKIRYLPFKFNWPALNGATKYRMQIMPADETGNIRFEDTNKTPEFILNVMTDGHYLLRIRAIDINGLEGFNAEHKFTIDTNFPVPTLSSPISNIKLSDAPHIFTWNKTDGTSQYQIQVSTKPDFSDVIINELVDNSSLTINSKLSAGSYYWRVAAIDSQANKGQQSKIGNFIVNDDDYEYLLLLLYLLPALLL